MKLLNNLNHTIAKKSNEATLLWLLKIACACIFLSRAWQHLVWNEALINSVYPVLGSAPELGPQTSGLILTRLIQFIGITYCLGFYASLKLQTFKSVYTLIIAWGGFNLLLLNSVDALSKNYSWVLFMEHTIQWVTPFLLLLFFKIPRAKFLILLKVSIILTFAGHGLFALGVFEVPGHFIAMVIKLTPIENLESALMFLRFAGIMDMLLCVGVFIPKTTVFFLWYAAVWGILTALARYFAFFDYQNMLTSTAGWFHETILRFPHGIIPFICLLITLKIKKILFP